MKKLVEKMIEKIWNYFFSLPSWLFYFIVLFSFFCIALPFVGIVFLAAALRLNLKDTCLLDIISSLIASAYFTKKFVTGDANFHQIYFEDVDLATENLICRLAKSFKNLTPDYSCTHRKGELAIVGNIKELKKLRDELRTMDLSIGRLEREGSYHAGNGW
jgi:hypothetical protein